MTQKKPTAVMVDVGKCLLGNLDPKHWNADGTCKCVFIKVSHLNNVLNGTWAALQLLTKQELEYLIATVAEKARLAEEREDKVKYVGFEHLVRCALEARNK